MTSYGLLCCVQKKINVLPKTFRLFDETSAYVPRKVECVVNIHK